MRQAGPKCQEQLIFNLPVDSDLAFLFQPTGSACLGRKFGTKTPLKVSLDQRIRLCSHPVSRDAAERSRANRPSECGNIPKWCIHSNLHCGTKTFKPVMFYKAACVIPASGFGSEDKLMQTSCSLMYQYVKNYSEEGHEDGTGTSKIKAILFHSYTRVLYLYHH